MNECLIKVQRDSVCMGDDVDAPHSYSFALPCDATLSELFEHLAIKRYLASVAGKNHTWEAVIGKKFVALFRGNNKNPEASFTLRNKVSKYANEGVLNVHFKYNSATT